MERVAKQVCAEIRAKPEEHPQSLQRVRWSMHGGLGTGKLHVITIIKPELFEQLLKYKMGVCFHSVALLAVMADVLSGDTIHHALNVQVYANVHNSLLQTVADNKR